MGGASLAGNPGRRAAIGGRIRKARALARQEAWAQAAETGRVLSCPCCGDCLSHETALAAWDVSDINPDRIHVTVGRTRRPRRAGGERTTIAQCSASGVPTYLIRQALERAGRTVCFGPPSAID